MRVEDTVEEGDIEKDAEAVAVVDVDAEPEKGPDDEGVALADVQNVAIALCVDD